MRVGPPGTLGSCSPVCLLGVLCCLCSVLGHLAPVHRCARSARCVVCAVSWTTGLLFTGAQAWCVVLRVRCHGPLGFCPPVGTLRVFMLRVRCPGPLGSCSPVCSLSLLCCLGGILGHSGCCAVYSVCGVLDHLAPVHRSARSARCVACAVSLATWLLFTRTQAWCVVLRVRCHGPLGFCPPVGMLCVLCCVCGVLGPLAPVLWCARSACCVGCPVSWATLLLFAGVLARCVVLCIVCAVSWATWLLFTGVLARRVVLRVQFPGPPGSSPRVCKPGVLCCVCGVMGHLASVHRWLRSVCCVACAVSWAPWLLFSCVLAPPVVLPARCPRPLCSCLPVCSLDVLCCVLCVRCPGPLGSCSPVCALGVVCSVFGASLRGRHSSIPTAGIRSRQGLGTLRARTGPSERQLVRSRQGLGTLVGAHSSIRTAALP